MRVRSGTVDILRRDYMMSVRAHRCSEQALWQVYSTLCPLLRDGKYFHLGADPHQVRNRGAAGNHLPAVLQVGLTPQMRPQE